jgi:hypothetical protein
MNYNFKKKYSKLFLGFNRLQGVYFFVFCNLQITKDKRKVDSILRKYTKVIKFKIATMYFFQIIN